MEPVWLDVGPVTVRAPTNAATNLLLAIQCCLYWLRLRGGTSARERHWGGFFGMMAAATLAGVFKHGARHVMSASVLTAILGVSNVASGVATYMAQEATIVSDLAPDRRGGLRLLIDAQLAAFLAVNVVFGPEIVFLIVNTAVGLLPVIVTEALRRRRVRGGGLVAAGLATSVLTGLVYVVGVSPSRWFNHIDVAHLLMGVSFLVIARGLKGRGCRPTPADGSRLRPEDGSRLRPAGGSRLRSEGGSRWRPEGAAPGGGSWS